MEFTTTKRGGRVLLYEGHRYVINRRGRDERIFWRCSNRECTGSLTTLKDNTITTQKDHNHPGDQAAIEVEKIVVELKEAAKETVRPIPTLYHEKIQRIAVMPNKEEVSSKMPTFEQIKTSLYESRRQRLPALPTERAQVHFSGEWTKTASGESFLLAEDGSGDDKIVVFATDTNIKILCEADTIYVDGTFQTCPKLFYQIFTIHAFKQGKQHPSLCFLA